VKTLTLVSALAAGVEQDEEQERGRAVPEFRAEANDRFTPTTMSAAATRDDRFTSTPVRRCGNHAADFDHSHVRRFK
jgi:hypothetical protein